jgi:hypothetical protein
METNLANKLRGFLPKYSLYCVLILLLCVGSDCVTPSNPLGLRAGHGIEYGEGLDIWQVLDKLKSAS